MLREKGWGTEEDMGRCGGVGVITRHAGRAPESLLGRVW